MYPMAMPPQYGGSHQPILHSSIYTPPLISPGSYTTAQSFSHPERQSYNRGRQYEAHPNISSFYVNPQIAENDFGLHRNCITSRLNSSAVANQSQHSSIHGNSATNQEPPIDSHAVSLRQKHFYGSNKQPSLMTINEDLLYQMTKMHLGYIETEDSMDKMEQRQKLEDKILTFLSITPHQSKFAFPEVLEVLENSVSMSSNFNAHKTACAFDALAQYASNLLSQPWRKEFRELKLYSGFWVHQISNYLVGAHTILELMGYIPMYSKEQKNQFCSSGMPYQYLYNGVLDPDLISRLALDCIIAYCECQCLHRIREGLDSFDFGFSQILEFRQRYIGDTEGNVRHLLYNLKQNLQMSKDSEAQRMKQLSCSPPPLPSRCSSHTATLHDRPPLKSPSSSSANKHFAMPSNQDKHRITDGSQECVKTYKNHSRGCSNYDTGIRTEHWDTEDNAAIVPTARLIDLDSSIDGSSRNRRLLPKIVNRKWKSANQDHDETDFRPTSSQQLSPDVLKSATLEEHMKATLDFIANTPTNKVGSRSEKGNLEAWDFVFKNLEKKGYSKDIGDRGDILNELKQNSFQNETMCTKSCLNNKRDKHRPLLINQALQQLSLNENRDKVDGASQTSKSSGVDKHGVSKRISQYDNLSTTDSPPEEEHNSRPALKKMSNVYRETKNDVRESKNQQVEPVEYVERQKRPRKRNGDSSSWSCAACTYLNERLSKACEMCGKSRLFGRDDTPLESGSKQCSKCTLINQRGATLCSACDSPLEACSTYI